MEEKVYNLLEKLYSEMTSFKNGQQGLSSKFAKIEEGQEKLISRMDGFEGVQQELVSGQQELCSRIDKLELRIENEVIDKIRGLYDFREVQTDINYKILSTLDKIDAKIDVLQMETSNLRRVK